MPIQRLLTYYILVLFVTLISCIQRDEEVDQSDKLLAQVQNHKLFLSDIADIVPSITSHTDSMIILNAFIERWVRDAALMVEAEKNVPNDLNIDKLIRDYRASLIKHHYEQKLINELLDSLVTQQQMVEFYQKNKEQFILSEPIVQCQLLKFQVYEIDERKLKKWWRNWEKEDQFESLFNYASEFALTNWLKDSTWLPVSRIVQEFPPGKISESDITRKKELEISDETYLILFRQLNSIQTNEIPPLEFVEKKVRRLILHQRKQQLLQDKKDAIYEREMRLNNIKIFLNK